MPAKLRGEDNRRLAVSNGSRRGSWASGVAGMEGILAAPPSLGTTFSWGDLNLDALALVPVPNEVSGIYTL